MKLIIDIGNTRLKAAIFGGKNLKEFFVFKDIPALLASPVFATYPIQHCILGTVVNNLDEHIEMLKKKLFVLVFKSDTKTPVKNTYKTIHTLGSDRLAAAVGANAQFKNQNCLVIDAGTCIKYNFINNKNEYIGGGISPGLTMRLKAMHAFTSRLPLLPVNDDFNNVIGANSEESMLSGALLGAVMEADGFISAYQQKYPDLKVVLTGGDMIFFEKRLKNRIFADSFLILKGLNEILDYNLNIDSSS